MKCALTAISFLCLAAATAAQEGKPALPEVANIDSSFIRQPAGESEQMHMFFDKMDSVLLLGQGRVNILHIGGSHVQADMYTNVVRNNIDSLNHDLRPPRGFIFPYSVAKTNNPISFKVQYGGEWTSARNAVKQFVPTQGLSGILVMTTDSSAWFSVDLDCTGTGRWNNTTTVHLIARSTGGKYSPLLTAGSDSVPVAATPEKTGYRFDLPTPTGQFRISLSTDSLRLQPDTFIVSGLIADNDEAGIVYHSIGVNGASVPSYLGCAYFERDLALVKPDLVVFGLGINDASTADFTDSLFCANYDMLIGRIRSVAPDCALLFITNNDSYKRIRRRYYVNNNGPVARESFYKLACRWQGAVWDMFEVMGGLNSMAEWEKIGLARRDKIHFTREGYEIIGQLFYDALLNCYLDSEP